MHAYIEILRPFNALMAAVAVAVSFFLAGGTGYSFLFASASVFLVLGAGMVVNDYFDKDIDAKNKPRRPIPSGRVRENDAVIYSLTLFFFGVGCAGVLGIETLLIALTTCLLLLFYAQRFAGMPGIGNVIVSVSTGLAYIFGAAAAGNTFHPLLLGFAVVTLLSTFSREVYKDVEDMKADYGFRTTLPIKFGRKKAMRIAGVVGVLSAVGAVGIWLSGMLNMAYLGVALCAAILTIICVYRKNAVFAAKHLKQAQAILLLGMLSAVIL